MVDVNQIASTARTHWWSGTNEIQLARAAREFECDLVLERRSDDEQARKLLIKYLREQTPVLLCVDEWTHWITVLRAEGDRFVIVDSNSDPVLAIRTWPQLRNWWRYRDTDYSKTEPPILYDLMAVQPRERIPRGSARDLQATVAADRGAAVDGRVLAAPRRAVDDARRVLAW